MPSYTFIATSFAVVQAGAVPRFADVNLDDHCLSVASAEKLVTPRTRAIIPVHLYGNVCDMDGINALAKRHDLYVIEDNAQAFGGAYRGKKTGTLGHMAACSFCQNKTFTTGGEGGMVTTDDEDLAWEARSFRDHGYDVQERLNLLALEQKLPYIHNRVGMSCDIAQFVRATSAEGCPCWKVFWPQCHTERAFGERRGLGRSGFPFTSREYTDPQSVDYRKVDVPNARWHESHTFTCFAYPTFSEEDMQQIAAGLVKVIHAYS